MGIHVGKAWVFPLTLKLPSLLLLKTGTGTVTSGYPHRAFEPKLGLEDKASSRSISAAGSALVHPKCFVLLCGPQAAELLLKGEEKSVRCQEVLPGPAGLCPTVHSPCLPRPGASGCCICMKAPSLWAGCGSPLTVSGLSGLGSSCVPVLHLQKGVSTAWGFFTFGHLPSTALHCSS